MVNKRYLPVYIIYSIEREGENVGSGVFCMPFDSFANNVFLAKGNEQQVDFFIHGYTKFKFFTRFASLNDRGLPSVDDTVSKTISMLKKMF